MKSPVFTQKGGDEANETIYSHVKIICEEIFREIQDVKSILLAGGFGRGEGSVRISAEKILPVNDYDVYVITERDIPEEELLEISSRAERRIGTEGYSSFRSYAHYSFEKMLYVDLKCLTIRKLKELPPMIKYYELKHTGMVLYGEDPRKDMPDYAITEIPTAEGIRLLINRMSHLIEWIFPRHFEGDLKGDRDTLDNITFNCIKCFLSICGALLLLSGKYAPTYTGRMKNFERYFQGDYPDLDRVLPDLPEKVSYFTNLKLTGEPSEVENPVDLWFTTRDYLGIITKYVVSHVLKDEKWDRDWITFTDSIYRELGKKYLNRYVSYYLKKRLNIHLNGLFLGFLTSLAQFYSNIRFVQRINKFKSRLYLRPLLHATEPGLKIFAALPLVAFSIKRDLKVDTDMLKTAIEYLKTVYPVEIDSAENPIHYWGKVKDSYLEAYKLYYFQKSLI